MASSAHSPQKIKLCEHILLQHFGPITARVGALLLRRGRMTVRDLSRFLKQPTSRTNRGHNDPLSGAGSSSSAANNAALHGGDPNAPLPVPKRLIQQAIMTMIQHGCAWHSSTDPELADESQEYFEINPDEVLARLRFGKYISIAEDFIGEDAARIVTLILKHGKLQARDIVEQLTAPFCPQRDDGNDEQDEDDGIKPKGKAAKAAKAGTKRKAELREEELRVEAIKRQLVHLLYHTYLRPSTLAQHVSPRDKEIAYEARERRKIKNIPTPKELKEIRTRVLNMIADEREKEWEGDGSVHDAAGGETRRGLIRKAQSTLAMANAAGAPKSKRAKSTKDKKGKDKETANGAPASIHAGSRDLADDFELDLDVWLRVNAERFDIHVRNEIMVEAIRSKYNSTAAEVFRHLIEASEASSSRQSVRDESSAGVSLTLLAPKLPSSLVVQKGFDRRSFGKDKASLPTRQEFLAEYCAIFAHSDDISTRAKTQRFVTPDTEATTRSASGRKVASSYRIDYRNTAERMRKDLLRNVVEEKFGTAAVRIMGILREKGKLEEKHISRLALISINETRDICSRLFASSLLGLQEIPKTKDRDPAKTFFLWFVDEEKSRAWLVDRLYQTLARLGQRRNEEMRRQAPLLRKVERTDVKSDTVGLLSEWEREIWQRLDMVLKTISVAEMRVEMDVFVLRDLAVAAVGGEA
ncbi:RNA polymerase III subunit C82 [Thecaphora frezii]